MPRRRFRRKASRNDGIRSLASSLMRGRRTAARLPGGPSVWWPVFGGLFAIRLTREVLGLNPELVSIEKLEPGQFVGIEAIDPRTLSPAERKFYKR